MVITHITVIAIHAYKIVNIVTMVHHAKNANMVIMDRKYIVDLSVWNVMKIDENCVSVNQRHSSHDELHNIM